MFSNLDDEPPAQPSPLIPPPRLDMVYIAPDAAAGALELAQPPRVGPGPDGALVIELYNDAGQGYIDGRVLRIDHLPPFALVYAEVIGPPGDPCDPPLYVGYLVHDTALPRSDASAAALLRQQYGPALTVQQLATSAATTPRAVYAALRRRELEGTKRGGVWTFTPEQAAAWLAQNGARPADQRAAEA